MTDRMRERGRELAKLLGRTKRKEKLSYRQLSQELDANWTLIGNWIKGKVIPSFPSQERIERFLRKCDYGREIDRIDEKLGLFRSRSL